MGHRTKNIDLRKWLKNEMGFVWDVASESYVHEETQVEVPGSVVRQALTQAEPEEIRNMVADSVIKARQRISL
jgi:hypothetical protein